MTLPNNQAQHKKEKLSLLSFDLEQTKVCTKLSKGI